MALAHNNHADLVYVDRNVVAGALAGAAKKVERLANREYAHADDPTDAARWASAVRDLAVALDIIDNWR